MNPGTQVNKLHGYSRDGFYYLKGVKQPISVEYPLATWYTEPNNEYRWNPSPLSPVNASFPTKGLVLATDEGITIFSEAEGTLNVWMTFLKAPVNLPTIGYRAFLQSLPAFPTELVPTGLTYNNGVIVVAYTSNVYLYLDFNSDRVYADAPMGITGTAPIILTQPQPVSQVALGEDETYTVVAFGSNPLSYRWELTDIDGNLQTLDSTLPTVTIQAQNFDQIIRVTVFNDVGSIISSEVTCLAGIGSTPMGIPRVFTDFGRYTPSTGYAVWKNGEDLYNTSGTTTIGMFVVDYDGVYYNYQYEVAPVAGYTFGNYQRINAGMWHDYNQIIFIRFDVTVLPGPKQWSPQINMVMKDWDGNEVPYELYLGDPPSTATAMYLHPNMPL